MSRAVQTLLVSDEQRLRLHQIVDAPSTAHRLVRRAQMILSRAEGLSQKQTSERVSVNRPVISLWERRFREGGVDGLHEAPRSGRKPVLSQEVKSQIITEVTQPPKGRKRWSLRSMAKAKGVVSPSTVHVLWSSNGLKPHLTRTFKVSTDPPDRALVCSVATKRANARPWNEPSPVFHSE